MVLFLFETKVEPMFSKMILIKTNLKSNYFTLQNSLMQSFSYHFFVCATL